MPKNTEMLLIFNDTFISVNVMDDITVIFHFLFDSLRLQQVDENRKSVTNEIKKSICNLIMEINRKGKILVNQLEVLCCFSLHLHSVKK